MTAQSKSANDIASLFLLQALRHLQERVQRVTALDEEHMLLELLDWACNLGCLHARLSIQQERWVEDQLRRELGQQDRSKRLYMGRREWIVSYNGSPAGYWSHTEGSRQVDFEVDPALVVAFLSIDQQTLRRAAQERETFEQRVEVEADPSLTNRWTMRQTKGAQR